MLIFSLVHLSNVAIVNNFLHTLLLLQIFCETTVSIITCFIPF